MLMLYRIGEFSKLTGIPIRTLRYYDSIDLFKPSEVDLFTSYRYYKEEQVKDLELINELKEVGFTLEEIRDNWNNFSEELFIQSEQFVNQDQDFKTGIGLDIRLEPKGFGRQLLYASSASDTSSEFYKKYKQFSEAMIMGDPKYFVCAKDINLYKSLKPSEFFTIALT